MNAPVPGMGDERHMQLPQLDVSDSLAQAIVVPVCERFQSNVCARQRYGSSSMPYPQ